MYTYKKSSESSIVPSDWKKANVTAVSKKGDKSSSSYYRPISLTSQVCKVFESIVRDCIIEHVKKHKPIKKSQHVLLRIDRV